MKAVHRLRNSHSLVKVSIFVILVAFIAGMAGCGNTTPAKYTLTMAVAGGDGTATDLTSASPYAAGTKVSIKAVPAVDHQFIQWSAPWGWLGNATAAMTTFTMPAQNVTVTANFAAEIHDWYDLDAIRNNLDGNYVVVNNLDSTTPGYTELTSPTANGGKGWQPIGTDDPTNMFTGVFHGGGYEIHDLFISRPQEGNPVGLFSSVGDAGVIRNIGVVNITVISEFYPAGLVGQNYGTITNSYCTGSVNGTSEVGGLVGANYGTVSDCFSSANVTGQTGHVGGLVGLNCLVGQYAGTISNSYSVGRVVGDETAGGLVGYGFDPASNCFWDMQTSGQTTSWGGTGKNTTEMKDITTFSDAGWNIIAVALNETNPAYIWNIVNNVTYPFFSWQAV